MRTARNGHAAEAQRLVQTRTEPPAGPAPGLDAKLRRLIVQELSAGAGREKHLGGVQPIHTQAIGGDAPARHGVEAATPESTSNANEAKREAVQAVVEKIETFVRANRPGLTLSLNGTFATQVQLEKTGPGQVAVRLQGRNGPPRPEDLSLLREQLHARGIKLSALSIG